jgi:prepilin-type N-terminal cleavage/methylation domain-containing protein
MKQNNLTQKKLGFTVVESLVALAIVSVVSLAGLGTMSYIRKVKNRSKEICAAHVASTVEKFRSVGYFAAISTHFPLTSGTSFGTVAPDISLSKFGLADNQMYPNDSIITYPNSGGNPPTVNNEILITSSLNALAAIYNSSGSFCSNANGASYTNSTPPTVLSQAFGFPSSELKSANLTLRIIPYNARTGDLDTSCPSNIRIVPPGRYSDGDSGSPFYTGGTAPPKLRRSGSQRTDVGLSLKVTQTYIDEDNVPQSCSIEQRFQYAADMVPSPPPDQLVMSQTAGPTRTVRCPVPSANRFEVTIGYNTNTIEPGSVMVCRDVSVVPTTPAAGHMLASCMGTNAPAPTIPSSTSSSSPATYPHGLNSTIRTGMTYNYASAASASTPPWVPCDRVTACGVSPSSATPGGTAQKPSYSLIYNSLPYLCRVYIQVAAIDTASNSSDTYVTAHVAGDSTVADTSINFITWDVPIPSCGRDCSYGWPGFTPYYRCGSCPVYP